MPVDRIKLNDALTALLASFGWVSDTDDDDDQLNELTHHVADFIEGKEQQ